MASEKSGKSDDMNMRMRAGQVVSPTAALTVYRPGDWGGAVVMPVFGAATYAFEKAVDGRHAFGCAYGLAAVIAATEDAAHGGPHAMEDIYARLTTPNLRETEKMLQRLERTGPGKDDEADWALLFPSGMSAVTTLTQAACHLPLAPGRPNGDMRRDVVIHDTPLYGGTHAYFYVLSRRAGLTHVPVNCRDPEALRRAFEAYGDRVGLVFFETPANPTLTMADIAAVRAAVNKAYAGKRRPPIAVDNTFMGVFQHPLELGADVALYSATKFMGGHSDLIAGALVGRNGATTLAGDFDGDVKEVPLFGALMTLRTVLGCTPASGMAQQLWTHLKTYVPRMRNQSRNAQTVAEWLLHDAPNVRNVRFPSLFAGAEKELYERQCLGPSSIIAFEIVPGTPEAAERFLNALEIVERAVSLGSANSLVDWPRHWTHSDVPVPEQEALGIGEGLIRLSVGHEDPADIIADLEQALNQVI